LSRSQSRETNIGPDGCCFDLLRSSQRQTDIDSCVNSFGDFEQIPEQRNKHAFVSIIFENPQQRRADIDPLDTFLNDLSRFWSIETNIGSGELLFESF
jgi:hypothetical protein